MVLKDCEIATLEKKLYELADLPDDWDSYGAPRIDRFVL